MKNKESKNRQTKNKQKQGKIPVLDFKFSDLLTADYWLVTALLVTLPILVYAQVYNFEFVWDDEGSSPITGHLRNPFLSDLSWQNFTQLFSEQFFGMYIPISYLFWGILKTLAELLSLPVNSVLHLSNVVVHIVNGLLVFTILKQFVVNKWAVLIGTGFFLLHPIQVETVAWVSEFRSLLAAFFVLSSLYIYLKWKEKISYLSLFLFVLAVLSKPSAVTLVLFVFAINYFHYDLRLNNNIKRTLPFALIALIFVIIAYSVQSQYDTNISEYTITFWQRPFAWLDSIAFYLSKLIYPYHLSASYALSPKFMVQQWWFYPLTLMPLTLGGLLWWKRKQQPLLVFATVLFIAGFFATSGFVGFAFQRYSLVADRYVYFAMVGIALLMAAIFSKTDKKAWQGLIVSVLIIFASLSAFRQIPIWQNLFTLWSHSQNYEVTPRYAHKNLGVYFYNKGVVALKAKKHRYAINAFDKAIKVYPKNATDKLGKALYNKGVSLFALTQYQKAIDAFDKAIKVYPKNSGDRLGKAFYKKGLSLFALTQYQQAIDAFDKAINAYPKNATGRLANAFHNKGVSFFQQQKYQKALINFNQAIKLNSSSAKFYNTKIHLLTLLKQCQKAKEAVNSAKQHKVKLHAEILANLKQKCPN